MEVEEVFDAISRSLRVGINVFCLLRGLPGRGKTTAALKLRDLCLQSSLTVNVTAADDFMVDEDGNYSYDRGNNGYCHTKCTSTIVDSMLCGTQVVICHNTNTLSWESAAARANAEELGYLVYVFDIKYAWCANEDLPADLQGVLVNAHGVGGENIEAMRNRMQPIFPVYTGLFTSYSNLPVIVRQVSEEMVQRASSPPFSYKIFKHNRVIIHSTMEHSGSSSSYDDSIEAINKSKINSSNFYEISELNFQHQRISILGLFFNEAGVGAVVGDETCTDVRCMLGIGGEIESAGEVDISDGTKNLPYYLFTRDEEKIRSVCPHLTLAVFQGFNSKDVGSSGRAFLDALTEMASKSPSSSSSSSPSNIPFDQFFSIGDRFSAYLFSESQKQSLDTVYGCNFGVSVGTFHKFQHFQWKFPSSFERDTYLTLVNRADVQCGNYTLPEQVLGENWSIVDLKVRAPRGKSDDELYASDEFLRINLPRGLAFLISPDKAIVNVIKGLPKFSGVEDSVEDMIVNGDKSLYFRRPLTAECKLLVTEKANGEAAHFSFFVDKLDGSIKIVSGSKNVHIVTRLDHSEDVDLYSGDRYGYAKDICSCFYDVLSRLSAGNKSDLINYLVENKLTAIFEYEDPTHQHIVPIAHRSLKFISFISLERSFEDIEIVKLKSICAIFPEDSFRIMEEIGISRVWSFTCSLNEKTELEEAILLEKDYDFEGCVLYYIDSTSQDVIGIEKVKSGNYICSRATREKFLSFISQLVKCLDPYYSIQKNLEKLMLCKDKNRYISAFGSICLSLSNALIRRTSGELERYKKLLLERFEEIANEQVPLSGQEKDTWLRKGYYLFDRNSNEFYQLFQDEFDSWSKKFRDELQSFNETNFKDLDRESVSNEMIVDGNITISSVNMLPLQELCYHSALELQNSFDELIELFYNGQMLRDRWPQIYSSVS